jgi:hypothetical protein
MTIHKPSRLIKMISKPSRPGYEDLLFCSVRDQVQRIRSSGP